MSSEPISIKLVIVGDGAIGKTCILVSYSEGKFPSEYEPTVFDNTTINVKVDNQLVNLGIWDTAGQQQYDRLRPLAYSSCDVFVIAFSVVDPKSFRNAKEKWLPEIQAAVPQAIKIMVGNKTDLRESEMAKISDPKLQPIAKETARKIIETETKCKYFECSALTSEGVKTIFDEAVRAVLANKMGGMRKKQTTNEGSTCSGCALI